MSSFVKRLCESDDERFCRPDWFEHYDTWRDAFGNCNVVFYDEVATDVFGAFVKAARLPSMPELIDIQRAQVSLDIYQLAYLLEARDKVDDFTQLQAASAKASRQLAQRKVGSLLSDADLARLRDSFQSSNHRLLAALGRDDDSLLQLDATTDSFCDLGQLYLSDSYLRYRDLANAIYRRRNRRRTSWFRR
jgi:hypothetical protein